MSETQTGYFLGDALGSVRQVVDPQAEILLAQSYSPNGELLSSVGDYVTAYSYTGEMTDGTGLVNLRARYYDPGTGRFVSRDTWTGDYNNPITLGKWLYANGNPIVYTDPSGKMGIVALSNFVLGDPYNGAWKPDGSKNGDEFGNNQITYRSPGWTQEEKNSVNNALWDIAKAYSNAYTGEIIKRSNNCVPPSYILLMLSKSPSEVFLKVHGGPITFVRLAENATQYYSQQKGKSILANYWALSRSATKILVFRDATADIVVRHPRWIVHEVGHSFENAMEGMTGAKAGRGGLSTDLLERVVLGELNGGFAGGFTGWQYSKDKGEDGRGEIFADMFIGWVYNQWEVNENGLTDMAKKTFRLYESTHAWLGYKFGKCSLRGSYETKSYLPINPIIIIIIICQRLSMEPFT